MLFVLCACGKKDMEPDKISQPETAGATGDVTAENMKMEDIMTERADTALHRQARICLKLNW